MNETTENFDLKMFSFFLLGENGEDKDRIGEEIKRGHYNPSRTKGHDVS